MTLKSMYEKKPNVTKQRVLGEQLRAGVQEGGVDGVLTLFLKITRYEGKRRRIKHHKHNIVIIQ